MNIVCSYIGA